MTRAHQVASEFVSFCDSFKYRGNHQKCDEMIVFWRHYPLNILLTWSVLGARGCWRRTYKTGGFEESSTHVA